MKNLIKNEYAGHSLCLVVNHEDGRMVFPYEQGQIELVLAYSKSSGSAILYNLETKAFFLHEQRFNNKYTSAEKRRKDLTEEEIYTHKCLGVDAGLNGGWVIQGYKWNQKKGTGNINLD